MIANVEKIETVTGDFYTEPGEAIWRVVVGEYCADFDFEEAARNFAGAINSGIIAPACAADIVDAIIDSLTDRRGLRHVWDNTDVEVQHELRDEWIEIVNRLSLPDSKRIDDGVER